MQQVQIGASDLRASRLAYGCWRIIAGGKAVEVTPVREGAARKAILAAVDEAVPAPVLTAALYARFSSRGEADFQNQLLSAMRYRFGGHIEKPDHKTTA